MRKISKALVASTIGIAALVPATYAFAQTSTTTPTPVCTEAQRTERWAARDDIRAQVLADLQAKGITDPAQLRDQLRTQVRAEMEKRFGDLPEPGYTRNGAGLGGGRGMGGGGGQGRMHGAAPTTQG